MANGPVELVGTNTSQIVKAGQKLFEDGAYYERVAKPAFPYGDGTAARQIVEALEDQLFNG